MVLQLRKTDHPINPGNWGSSMRQLTAAHLASKRPEGEMQLLSTSLNAQLSSAPHTWLVTGCAGFIGSNLVQALLMAGQRVVGLDNFATGHRRNLDEVKRTLPSKAWSRFELIEGDIRDRSTCQEATASVDYALHQAALGSVPRSIDDPLTSHDANTTGFINILEAARRANVTRLIYAASSSVYGDSVESPKREDRIGSPLSPYAATKLINEIYADTFSRVYGFKATGLRYFNVFGPRQDPDGAYAAVVPRWASAMVRGEELTIYGDGLTSRDFCYVANVVEANVRAALAPDNVQGKVFNIAVGEQTSLVDLFNVMRECLSQLQVHYKLEPLFEESRLGDVRHSLADITKAHEAIGYTPKYRLRDGLMEAMPWYLSLVHQRQH